MRIKRSVREAESTQQKPYSFGIFCIFLSTRRVATFDRIVNAAFVVYLTARGVSQKTQATTHPNGNSMRTLKIGDVTITSIIERDGPWRRPEDMFPAYDADIGRRHLAELDPAVFDPASGRMVIPYQTFVVRTPKHIILVDTCTGEDKGYPPPFDFPKQPWLDGFAAAGLRFDDIDYVFCTHLHIDHSGWNTVLRNGRWVPTFPKAKYVFHKREYAAWEESTKRGENRPAAAAMCGASTASRWWRPARRCWSTTILRSTIRCG